MNLTCALPDSINAQFAEEALRYILTHIASAAENLHRSVSDAIRHHHCPTEAVFSEHLSGVVGAANQLSKIWNIGVEGQAVLCVEDVLAENNLAFDEATIAEMCDRAPADYAECQKAFGV